MSALPEVCVCCGRQAIGVGFSARRAEDNTWVCAECVPLLDYIKDVRRWSVYEDRALKAVDEATGDYAAEHGTDIAAYSPEVRRGLWRCAIKAHQAEIRRLVRSDEAMW